MAQEYCRDNLLLRYGQISFCVDDDDDVDGREITQKSWIFE